MNFPTNHIERIKEFGYTESEARFLYIVAVHSGYFTLGQFRAFTDTAYGKRPTSFAQKVVKRGHATIRDYMRRGSIFHLFSRTIYGQIDKDNLRNRKRHSFDFMRSEEHTSELQSHVNLVCRLLLEKKKKKTKKNIQINYSNENKEIKDTYGY